MELLRLGAVTGRTGLSRSSIYYLIGKGEFPRPVYVGARAVAWVSEESDEWIKARIQGGRSPAGQAARTRVSTSESETVTEV
jgi:prophage regulatory protein